MKLSDEEKARKVIEKMEKLKDNPGLYTYIKLDGDFIDIEIHKFDKKVLSKRINMMNLSEMTHDELTYVLFKHLM